jgi:hypothetical protein
MADIMTAAEIKERFDSEWVLVGDPEVEENLVVKRGKVLWHGKDREELNRFMDGMERPLNVAILYTGTISKEEAIALKLLLQNLRVHGSPV